MAKVTIDGKQYEVNPEHNLLQECLSLGLDLPYFCWHPCMGSVGACRQCAVKQFRNADDRNGMVVMACMTPASDGSIISVNDPQARQFRAGVIESLMISHPHDCPVCEEGGECHLQDMTLMSGHNYRRYDRQKVTHNNQYLGPFVGHEMNRCIACYRCVRYYNDYAGGTDLSAQSCHHHVYFGRQSNGVLESEFSGNLVEVCPTGVFTDATFSAHYSRKWDLQTAPSICTGCAAGCNTTPGERYGTLRRIVNRYHGEVNGYFLCDRGRFGYGFVNHNDRLRQSFVRRNGEIHVLEPEQARNELRALLGPRTLAIGSPRAGNEANFSLRRLVGAENFHAGMSDCDLHGARVAQRMATALGITTPSIHDIEKADAVLIIGEDLTNTAPRLALALRQTVRNRALDLAQAARIPLWQDAAVRELAQGERTPLYQLLGYGSRLDDVATETRVDNESALLALLAVLSQALTQSGAAMTVADSGSAGLVNNIAATLLAARRPLIITGSGAGSMALIDAAAGLALRLAEVRGESAGVNFCCLCPEVNSMGLSLLAPSEHNGLSAALERMTRGEVDHVIVLENDLYRRAPAAQVDTALAAVKCLAVIDQLPSATTGAASLVLASCSFAEQPASYVNYEGRAQLSYQVFRGDNGASSAWYWLAQPGEEARFNDILSACAGSEPLLAALVAVLPDPARYPDGLKVPRQSHRYSGRTAMTADIAVNEPRQPRDDESVMSFSMEGVSALKDAHVLSAAWAPQWNSNQAVSKFQAEIAGSLRESSGEALLFAGVQKQLLRPWQPAAPVYTGTGMQAVRVQQIFGSDELSSWSTEIRQRMTGNYVGVAPTDAAALGLSQGQRVEVRGRGVCIQAAMVIRQSLKPGMAAIYLEQAPGDWEGLHGAVTLSKLPGTGNGHALHNLIVSDLLSEGAGHGA